MRKIGGFKDWSLNALSAVKNVLTGADLLAELDNHRRLSLRLKHTKAVFDAAMAAVSFVLVCVIGLSGPMHDWSVLTLLPIILLVFIVLILYFFKQCMVASYEAELISCRTKVVKHAFETFTSIVLTTYGVHKGIDCMKREAREEGLVDELGLLALLISPVFGVEFSTVAKTIGAFASVSSVSWQLLSHGELFNCFRGFWISSNFNRNWFGRLFPLPMAGWSEKIHSVWRLGIGFLVGVTINGVFQELHSRSVKRRERAGHYQRTPSLPQEAKRSKRRRKTLGAKEISGLYDGDNYEVFYDDQFVKMTGSEFKERFDRGEYDDIVGLSNLDTGEEYTLNNFESLVGKSQLPSDAIKVCRVDGDSCGCGVSVPKGILVMKHFIGKSTSIKIGAGKQTKEILVDDLVKTSHDELLLIPRELVGNIIGVTRVKGVKDNFTKPRSGVMVGINRTTNGPFIAAGIIGNGKHNMPTQNGCCGSALVDLDGASPKLVGIHYLGADAKQLNGHIPIYGSLAEELGLC